MLQNKAADFENQAYGDVGVAPAVPAFMISKCPDETAGT